MNELTEKLRAKPFFSCGMPAKEAEIHAAEEKLGVRFAEDYRAYLKELGNASFGLHELTGLCAISRLHVVCVTEEERLLDPDAPADAYVLESDEETETVFWQDASGRITRREPYGEPEKVCDSLKEYIEL